MTLTSKNGRTIQVGCTIQDGGDVFGEVTHILDGMIVYRLFPGQDVQGKYSVEFQPDQVTVIGDPDVAGARVDPFPGVPEGALIALDLHRRAERLHLHYDYLRDRTPEEGSDKHTDGQVVAAFKALSAALLNLVCHYNTDMIRLEPASEAEPVASSEADQSTPPSKTDRFEGMN